jgi:diacylglycerol O-acyltransferase / wax synthase
MAQDHFDRLSAVDASFLHQETPSAHMHVGGVMIFEGPPPTFDEFNDALRARLHLVPRYRRKLVTPPVETGRPLWIDDPSFNVEYHVRQSALPSPGSEQQLMALAARIMSQQLDRSKPLWETWLIEGLQDKRFALITKTHHALIDGVSDIDLTTVILDVSPVPQAVEHPPEAWQPRREPGRVSLLASGVLGLARTALEAPAKAVEAVARPQTTVVRARDAAQGIGELIWASLNPAPVTPLNVEIGPHRRIVGVRTRLADFKHAKDAFGGTVNDVVIAVVSGALRTWLRSRGVRTEGLELRALLPVSIRTGEEHAPHATHIEPVRAPLPVYVEDPVARLRAVKQSMEGLKESKHAVGARILADVENFAPPTVLAQAARLTFSTRLFNLIVTNVPGPQFPLYLLGRELQDIFPVGFLPKSHALSIAVMSYNGKLTFGLLGDYDALHDLAAVAENVETAIAELLVVAKRHENGGARATPAISDANV